MPEPSRPAAPRDGSFLARLALAFAAFWRALRGLPLPGAAPLAPAPRALPESGAGRGPQTASAPPLAPPLAPPPTIPPLPVGASPTDGVVVLLRLLQREGRLVDFLLEDLAGAADVQIASAARLLHQGCRRALLDHVDLTPIARDREGEETTVPAGFSPAEIQLHGEAGTPPPFPGRVVHPGWRVGRCDLPGLRAGDRVVAPAEIEVTPADQTPIRPTDGAA